MREDATPKENAMLRHSIRIALAVPFAAAAAFAYAQSPGPATWACMAGGKEVNLQITPSEATVAIAGEQRRTMKRQETMKGNHYSDGTMGLRMRDPDPARAASLIDEFGQTTLLMRCHPAAG
jgi:hypothetical protein